MGRVGETIGGKFELTELVGRSEFGTTYRAKTPSGTTVAVKLFHDDLDPVLTRNLFGNAKIMSAVKHSRVARVLGAKYSKDSDTYLVTQWMNGEPLSARLKTRNALSAPQTAEILFQLCSALAPIHKANLPHGNLKPSNVFLNKNDSGEEHVCITDIVGSGVVGLRDNNEFAGSVKNMSPSQVQGSEIAADSDFFSLGALGYLLLTGQYPFAAPTPAQTADKIRNRSYRALKETKNIDESPLTLLIEKCMNQDSADQFTSLRDIASGLAAYLKNLESQEDSAEAVDDHANPSAEDDPDATMAFQVPDELQAFLDQHDGILDDEASEPPPILDQEEPDDTMDRPIGELKDEEDLQQPFFTEASDDVFSTPNPNVDNALLGTEPVIQPGQEIDDDLPFHSVSISQSVLEEEASQLDSVDEITSKDAVTEASSGPVLDVNDILPDSEEALEADDIMKALSSTIEAVGPSDVSAPATVQAPLMDMSDFEELATGEFERRAKDSNRFLSADSQTGLRRPIFTLFLLSVLGMSAILYQFIVDEDSERFKAEQAKLRQMRVDDIGNQNSALGVEKKSEAVKTEDSKDKTETKKADAKPKSKPRTDLKPKPEIKRERPTGKAKAPKTNNKPNIKKPPKTGSSSKSDAKRPTEQPTLEEIEF